MNDDMILKTTPEKVQDGIKCLFDFAVHYPKEASETRMLGILLKPGEAKGKRTGFVVLARLVPWSEEMQAKDPMSGGWMDPQEQKAP